MRPYRYAPSQVGYNQIHFLISVPVYFGVDTCNGFLVQRMDAERFRPAAAIDPDYAAALQAAAAQGVEVLAYDAHIDLTALRLRRRLPVEI